MYSSCFYGNRLTFMGIDLQGTRWRLNRVKEIKNTSGGVVLHRTYFVLSCWGRYTEAIKGASSMPNKNAS